MKKFTLALFLFFTGGIAVHGQISIDTITTDTVNIFDLSNIETPKSAAPALLMSVLLPGTGHQIMNRPKSALVYLSVDIISLFGAIAFQHYSTASEQNAKSLAYAHAQVKEVISDDYFAQMIGNYNSYHDFHSVFTIDTRNFSDRFTEPKYLYSWDGQDDIRNEYTDLRKRAKRMSTLSAFFIGAMAINRLVSIIDMRTLIKNRRYTSSKPAYSLSPVFASSSGGIVLSTTF